MKKARSQSWRRLVVFTLALATMVNMAAPVSAGEKSRKDLKGGFTATALPSYHLAAYAYPTVDYECGLEGVTFTSEPFEAPDEGTLIVEMADFVGDWDVAILEQPSGAWMAGSYRDNLLSSEAHERATIYLVRGDIVEIRACNYLGAPSAEVTYEFRFAR